MVCHRSAHRRNASLSAFKNLCQFPCNFAHLSPYPIPQPPRLTSSRIEKKQRLSPLPACPSQTAASPRAQRYSRPSARNATHVSQPLKPATCLQTQLTPPRRRERRGNKARPQPMGAVRPSKRHCRRLFLHSRQQKLRDHVGRPNALRLPSQPEEVHQGHEDGIRRPEEGARPSRSDRLSQGKHVLTTPNFDHK